MEYTIEKFQPFELDYEASEANEEQVNKFIEDNIKRESFSVVIVADIMVQNAFKNHYEYEDIGHVILKHNKVHSWAFCQGKKEIGESSIDAMYRELREELGLEHDQFIAKCYTGMSYVSSPDKDYIFVFFRFWLDSGVQVHNMEPQKHHALAITTYDTLGLLYNNQSMAMQIWLNNIYYYSMDTSCEYSPGLQTTKVLGPTIIKHKENDDVYDK